jgi:ABC-type glycerol-3-phosphate transport system substrate-binding protein
MKSRLLNRRDFLRASASAATGMALAACAPVASPEGAMDGDAPASAPAEVNWLGPFVPAYRFEWLQGPLMDMWRDVNSDITIVMEQATSWPDTEEKVLIRSAAGGGPDLVQTGETGAVTDFAARGLFASLDPFLDADPEISVDLFYEAPMLAGQYEGVTYALPQDSITMIFFYNKAHFEEAGLSDAPATFADVAVAAEALTALDGVDFGLQAVVSNWGNFASYLYANGGSFLDEACAQPLFNDATGVETLTFLMEQVNAGVATPHGSDVSVQNGRASMVTTVPWIVGWTLNNAPEINEVLGATIMPAGNAGNDVWGWAHYESLLDASEAKDAAWTFLSWMLSEDIDLVYHENLNFLPGQPRTFAKPPFSDHWAWTVFAQQLEQTRPMPLCVSWREINADILRPELEAAWIGEKSPQEALDTAAANAMDKL